MANSSQTPCAMCGRTGYKRTREHIFPRSWKSEFPWLNSPFGIYENDSKNGSVRREMPVELFEQQVSPFCGECNREFMRDIDSRALPIFQRLARLDPWSLTAQDVSVLSPWAFKTSLVRSIQDEGSGMRAPDAVFREFRESEGRVPSRAIQLIARTDTRTAALANMSLTVTAAGEEPLWVQEMMVLFDTVVIISIALHGEAPQTEKLYGQAVDEVLRTFGPSLAVIGTDTSVPKLLLPAMFIDQIRAPSALLAPNPLRLPSNSYYNKSREDVHSRWDAR